MTGSGDPMPARVVVTGGSGGIGGAIVRRFAEGGSRVANLDIGEGAGTDRIRTVRCDLGDPSAIASAFDAVDAFFEGQAPDLFVGCAAISRAASVLDVTADELDGLFAVNVRGLFLSAQAAARRMARTRRGSIVLISSVAAEQAWMGESVYCMTKAATRAMTQSMAVELAPFGIRVNAVAPGPIEHQSRSMAATRADPEIHRHEIERTPLGRFGTPEEVAEAVSLVASAQWVNGATLTVDGGFMATGLGLFGAARDSALARRGEG